MTSEYGAEATRKSGFDDGEKPLDSLDISSGSRGQTYPEDYPQYGARERLPLRSTLDALGEPLTIREVAALLGCSAWTVRHAYLPKGLPYLRSGPLGKLIFYRTQVVEWILEHQRKGGK